MPDFTIILMGFDRRTLSCVVEPVYVPEALNQTEAAWLAAEGYESNTGAEVHPIYATPGKVELAKLALGG